MPFKDFTHIRQILGNYWVAFLRQVSANLAKNMFAVSTLSWQVTQLVCLLSPSLSLLLLLVLLLRVCLLSGTMACLNCGQSSLQVQAQSLRLCCFNFSIWVRKIKHKQRDKIRRRIKIEIAKKVKALHKFFSLFFFLLICFDCGVDFFCCAAFVILVDSIRLELIAASVAYAWCVSGTQCGRNNNTSSNNKSSSEWQRETRNNYSDFRISDSLTGPAKFGDRTRLIYQHSTKSPWQQQQKH